MRAVSTVLDVSLFLLLVGAAVATLVYVPIESVSDGPVSDEGEPADETVELLATTTATVNYSIERGLDRERPVGSATTAFGPYERIVRDAVANLLGSAAVSSAELDGDRLADHGVAFERAVVSVTEDRLHRQNVSTSVRAHWTPYPHAPLSGSVVPGERAPPDVDVHTATISVDSGVANVGEEVGRAARHGGFPRVADVLANATLEAVLPRDRTRLALRGGYPSANLTEARIRQVARALGRDDLVDDPDARLPTRDELQPALADRLEDDLRERYDDPQAAAADVRIDRVTITVRTWSA